MTDTLRPTTFDPNFPIANLVPGHKHPLAPANPRKRTHEIALPDLARSIHEQGVLQPLRIFTDEHAERGKFWVHVGERRLLASQVNLGEHPNARDTVPVLIVDGITPHDAFQESLTEQVNRLPLHEIEQYEAFAELKNSSGWDEQRIADHYGITKQLVRQRIALGKIAPKILKAWLNGEIDEPTAREFTRLGSHKEQEKLYDRLKKSHGLQAHSVRDILVPDQGEAARLVEYVGHDLYRERGGVIHEDLFNGVHGVSDPALASALAGEKLSGTCARLTSMEGWSWALPVTDAPAAWRHFQRSEPKMDLLPAEKKRIDELNAFIEGGTGSHQEDDDALDEIERIESAARFRAFTDRQKKKSGCVIFIDQKGREVIEAGIILPEPAQEEAPKADTGKPAKSAAKSSAKDDEPEEEKVAVLAHSQATELAVTLTESAALVMEGNFNLAMSAALAALASKTHGLPVVMNHGGMGSTALKLTNTTDFAKNLQTFLKMKPVQREQLFAKVVAASLQFRARSGSEHAMTDKDTAALVNAVDPKVMGLAILKRFDAGNFFERAPKDFALAAIVDCFGNDTKNSKATPKGEVVAYATENCGPAKWLPDALRFAGYSGPGAKQPAKPKAKAKAKKKATRK